MFANATTEQITQLKDIIEQLDRGARPTESNRRESPRIKIRSALDAVLLSMTGQPSLTVYSRNLSRSGIAFLSRRPFTVGERLAIPFNIPGKPYKLVLTTTTFSRYVRSGMYEVGARFLECIPDTRGRDRIPPHWLPAAPVRPVAVAAK